MPSLIGCKPCIAVALGLAKVTASKSVSLETKLITYALRRDAKPRRQNFTKALGMKLGSKKLAKSIAMARKDARFSAGRSAYDVEKKTGNPTLNVSKPFVAKFLVATLVEDVTSSRTPFLP